MCQLCLIDLKQKRLNQIYLLNSIVVNSSKNNEDGFGFFYNEIIKSHISGYLVTNLGSLINTFVIGNKPVLSHVRKATFVNGKKLVTDEKAHPFETDSLILAHNGSLEYENYDKEKEKYESMIDSEIFTHVLEEEYKEGISFVDALNNTMKKFTGKFAFLIYNKRDKNHYVIRGKTAELFYYNYFGGLIVNTDKECLFSTLIKFINTLELLGTKDLPEFSLNDIKEVEPEIIFMLKDSALEKVGELKERNKVIVHSADNVRYPSTTFKSDNYSKGGGYYNINKRIEDVIIKINQFQDDYSLSFYYMDRIFYIAFYRGIIEADIDDLELFTDNILPTLRKSTKKGTIKNWRKLKDAKIRGLNDYEIHTKFKIKFPYMLDDAQNLQAISELEENKNVHIN